MSTIWIVLKSQTRAMSSIWSVLFSQTRGVSSIWTSCSIQHCRVRTTATHSKLFTASIFYSPFSTSRMELMFASISFESFALLYGARLEPCGLYQEQWCHTPRGFLRGVCFFIFYPCGFYQDRGFLFLPDDVFMRGVAAALKVLICSCFEGLTVSALPQLCWSVRKLCLVLGPPFNMSWWTAFFQN